MSRLTPFFHEIASYSPQTYFVGGCLRQFFLDQPIHDYDFVCHDSAIGLAKHLSQCFQLPYFVLDAERDIARVVISAQDTLDFATIQGESVVHDLSLRDLTLNAMAYPVSAFLQQGFSVEHLIDPMGGYQDLKQGIIRGISEANFQADALRLVRVFRFAAQHAFQVDKLTLEWVQKNVHLLCHSASERILSEFEKILKFSHTYDMENLWKTGVLQQILSVPQEELFESVHALIWLNRILETLPETWLCKPLTGERSLRVLLRLYTLSFSHYFRDKSSQQIKMSTARDIVSTQKSKSPVVSAMSSSEWSLFQKITTGLIELSSVRSGDPVYISRVFRKISPAFLSVYAVAKVIYREQEPTQNLLTTMYLLWQEEHNPIAHPQVFLSGHEVALVCNEKPGPRIGQWLDLLLDAQATGEVTDQQSAVTYLRGLSANNTE